MSTAVNKPKEEVLRCLSLDGSGRYDLPAFYAGIFFNYVIYLRPEPKIIHYTKEKIFSLAHPEITLVSTHENHVISVSLDRDIKPVNMYVNINLVPEEYDGGYFWRDLEIDIKVVRGFGGNFSPLIVDFDEYEENIINDHHKLIAEQEISKIVDRIISRTFPFNVPQLEIFLKEQWSKMKNNPTTVASGS